MLLSAFDWQVFSASSFAYDLGTLTDQVKNTMIITTFVFIGIEGAGVCSRFARKREHVGQATVIGIIAGVAIVHTIFLYVAAGLRFVLLSCVILVPAALLYIKARNERDRKTSVRASSVSSWLSWPAR